MAKDGTFLINGEPYVPTATTQARTIKESPETSLTGWFQANKTTVYIVLGGVILGLIIYFYVKNQQASASSTAGTTDTSTTGVSTLSGSPDSGTSTSGAPDFSQIESRLANLQAAQATDLQDVQQLQKDEAKEKSATKKKPNPKPKKKNKGGGLMDGEEESYGGVFFPVSRYQEDMHVVRGNPFRNTAHRIVYSLG